jgi:uncharacterized Zn-binding protein involved in type VI secretion
MGRPAARVGDLTAHGSPLTPVPYTGSGYGKVLIHSKPAWRITDQHTCPMPNPTTGTPHGSGVTKPQGSGGGKGTTMIGYRRAACMGDVVMEEGAEEPLNEIVEGEPTVLIGQV